MKGILIYDPANDRLDIQGNDGKNYGGLHCGDVIKVLTDVNDATWKETRVEADIYGDWYLTGMYNAGEIPIGLTVCID